MCIRRALPAPGGGAAMAGAGGHVRDSSRRDRSRHSTRPPPARDASSHPAVRQTTSNLPRRRRADRDRPRCPGRDPPRPAVVRPARGEAALFCLVLRRRPGRRDPARSTGLRSGACGRGPTGHGAARRARSGRGRAAGRDPAHPRPARPLRRRRRDPRRAPRGGSAPFGTGRASGSGGSRGRSAEQADRGGRRAPLRRAPPKGSLASRGDRRPRSRPEPALARRPRSLAAVLTALDRRRRGGGVHPSTRGPST